MFKKYAVVRQQSEEDCGAACLATIAKHYGRHLSLTRSREAVGTGQLGTTLLGIRRGAEALGFQAQSGKVTPEVFDNLSQIALPAIIHWRGYHWVVLYGKKGRKYVIADPAMGLLYLHKAELIESWGDGITLLIEPSGEIFEEQEEEPKKGIGRYFKQALNYRTTVFQALLYAQVIGLLGLIYPFFIQILTDDVLIRGDAQLLRTVALGVMALLAVDSVLKLIEYTLVTHFGQQLQLQLSLEFGNKLLRLPLAYYESRRSGEVLSRLEDITRINGLVSSSIIQFPTKLSIGLVSFAFMLAYSRSLTLFSVGLSVMMTLAALIFLPALNQRTRRLLALDADNQGILVENFKGAMTFKSTTAEPQLWAELEARFGRVALQEFWLARLGIANTVFSGLISGVGGIALLWFGSSLVISQALTIGQLLAFNAMNANFIGLIGFIVGFADEFAKVKASAERFGEVMGVTNEILDDVHKPQVQLPADGDIQCTHLNFFYAGRVELLKDFSLTIHGGEVTALIGRSGCGKSTLVKVIAGLHSAQSGNVRIGSYNQSDLSLSCLRAQIGLVPQETHFWSRSILENFLLGAPNISFEQIVAACKVAEADEFISRLPNKYQTVLGEFGSNLSGGQRQRLAIARAISTHPPILILDEATAGLDPISETQLLHQLLTHRQGKTTLLISHRPSVVELADRIVLLKQGQLQLQGKLSELRGKPGDHQLFLNKTRTQGNSASSRYVQPSPI
ncbi:peptidase domain-containing ABC transporter [Romeria aff. gracilis LEGE 07310]|uniref:Peptidase domain-containing ABC transporter n=1 Tax=Vasconcelosia minhoensis LEGE 07310 TaxID=915328 RepID=A0A8J7AB10_9CYAN|nr:peptidase domain-containing ABC transporter [Romeria gracilis]MBE9079555.1 peptidase domain-containing ABC transporter [Romeria aff. gracilis LEGE 07310]